VNPNIVQKKYDLLFIENLEGEVFVVSGQAYPVREMLQGVRQAIDKWKNRSDSETLE
jgi:hypothetical protein